MNGRATWLAEVLTRAGLEVVQHDGWRTRSNGDFTNLRAVTWHHDASPAGDSPGVPAYMIRNWRNAGANCWVNRQGVWHLIGAGVSYHAGKVLTGKPGNWESIGVETDHTMAESWPPDLLDALRCGTAAILRHMDVPVDTGLEFHKTVCSPVGRKTDPGGLDITAERAAVAFLLRGPDPNPPASPTEDDDMARTCIPTTATRMPNSRYPFFRLTADGTTVLAYNGARLQRVDGNAYGIPYMTLPPLAAKPVGICEAPGGAVLVVCEDGGTIDVAAA